MAALGQRKLSQSLANAIGWQFWRAMRSPFSRKMHRPGRGAATPPVQRQRPFTGKNTACRPTGRNSDSATTAALIRSGARRVTPLNAKLNASTWSSCVPTGNDPNSSINAAFQPARSIPTRPMLH